MPRKKVHTKKVDNNLTAGHNDVVFEKEEESIKDATAKLRAKLKECQKERQEYLDGWQRARADAMNAKRSSSILGEGAREKAHEDVLFSLIPVLDSFDSAMKGDAWNNVDENWRVGITHVHSQFLSVLADYNIEVFGNVGDNFDPAMHESMDTEKVKSEELNDSVVQVLQKGYKKGDDILRPAKVIVGTNK